MSKYTHEYHINLPQTKVAELIETFYWCNGADDVIVTNGLITNKELQLDKGDTEFGWVEYIISPTDKKGWSSVWTDMLSRDDEKMLYDISKTENCYAIYGHLNDSVDNWRWIIMNNGITIDEYWYTGQIWVRFPEMYKPESLTIWEAFNSLDREYHHLTISGIKSYEYKNFANSEMEFITISVFI